ncbi:MAG TPA: aminopeptidase P family protein [Tenuifilaceae bacterium]|nr:aminopeptidase P family protein [Tenuifilaceae bacterium]
MDTKINERLQLLRRQMKSRGFDAYVIHHSDPHISEYIPDYWKVREWASGFSGSAGTLVLTEKKAALWTDSRYFLQAEQQLAGTGIELCKQGLPDTPDIPGWIKLNLEAGSTVGCNGGIISVSAARYLSKSLEQLGFKCSFDDDIASTVWLDRPPLPTAKAYIHAAEFAGISAGDKLESIRRNLLNINATACLMCSPDEVCWTLNLRGSDIQFNPVVLCYAYVDLERAILFVDGRKLDDEISNFLTSAGVSIMGYEQVGNFISNISRHTVLVVDSDKTNYKLYNQIPQTVKIVEKIGIVTEIKAKKQKPEVEGIHQAMVQDGVALVNFFYWLEEVLGRERLTELTVAKKLLDFRSKQQHFVSESFETIAGYRDHGAIVHYSATPESDYTIEQDGFLLIDSGGQYLNGTTDITRTVHLGKPNADEMKHYTLVLKGMISLAKARFPFGTRGSQLDTLAKMALWSNHLTYGHGTGHGVGYFLNVHEGPQQIRPENHLPIEPGMVMSDEPGIYISGCYGIRIENLILCTDDISNDFGRFLTFETLTLCPIDTKPIAVSMLSDDERDWLNHYHATVYEKLSPYLDEEHKTWLKKKTLPL